MAASNVKIEYPKQKLQVNSKIMKFCLTLGVVYLDFPLRVVYLDFPLRVVYLDFPLGVVYLDFPLGVVYLDFPSAFIKLFLSLNKLHRCDRPKKKYSGYS